MPTSTGFTGTWVNAGTGTQPINNNLQTRVTGQTLWNDELPTTTGSTQVVTGKTPDTPYEVRVKAENTAGQAFSTFVATRTMVSAPPAGSAIVLDSRVQNPRQTFVDSAGVTWGISLMGRVMYNGVEDATTGYVDLLVNFSGSVWQRNGQGNSAPAWYSKAISASPVDGGWAAVSSPLSPAQPYRIADFLRTCGFSMLPHWSNAPNSTIHLAAMNYLSNGTHAFKLFRCLAATTNPTDGNPNASIAALCSAGARGCFIVPDQNFTSWDFAGSIATQISRSGIASIFCFENTNEPGQGGLSVATVQSLSDQMNSAINARPDCAGIVPNVAYSPVTVNDSLINGVGDLTSRGVNWGNSHTYANIGTGVCKQPWANYNGPPAGLTTGQVMAPGRTLLFGEFGINYPGSTSSYELATAAAGGKMMLNNYLDNYYLGGAGSFIFDLFDITGETFRLFDLAGNPDPCATVLRQFATILRDDGATALTFNPSVIDYTIGVVGNGRYLKTQGSDGKDRLIIWNEPEVQDDTPIDISPSATVVTVTCNQAISSAFRYDPTVGTASQQTIGSKTAGQTFTVSLTGYPQIIIISP